MGRDHCRWPDQPLDSCWSRELRWLLTVKPSSSAINKSDLPFNNYFNRWTTPDSSSEESRSTSWLISPLLMFSSTARRYRKPRFSVRLSVCHSCDCKPTRYTARSSVWQTDRRTELLCQFRAMQSCLSLRASRNQRCRWAWCFCVLAHAHIHN